MKIEIKVGDLIVPDESGHYLCINSGTSQPLFKIYEENQAFLCVDEFLIYRHQFRKYGNYYFHHVLNISLTNFMELASGRTAINYFGRSPTGWKQNYEKIKKDFEQNKPIEGFIFLCPNGQDYTWRSKLSLESEIKDYLKRLSKPKKK